MQDRPNFIELLDSVRHFLETEIAPTLTDHRARFRTLVAMNALTILNREYQNEEGLRQDEAERLLKLLGKDQAMPSRSDELALTVTERNRELAALIRSGNAPEGTLAHLRHVGVAKLSVASPGYLKRYEQAA
jgi:hypothetical protein